MGLIIAFSSFSFAALSLCGPTGQEATAAPDVDVQWDLPGHPVYSGQALPLGLQIVVPEAWLDGPLLQLFPQRLDLPIQVAAFEALESGRLQPLTDPSEADGGPGAVASASRSIVLDGSITPATGPVLSVSPMGRMATFHVVRTYVAPRAGVYELPAPSAHYAIATEFRDDFVQGRVPVDRRTVDRQGAGTSLSVLELPEAGRPIEFNGAVGRYQLHTQGSPSEVSAGEAFTVDVEVECAGGRADLDPRAVYLEDSDAFGEQGRTTTHHGTGQVITLSLVALQEGQQALPKARLAYFDPTLDPPRYEWAVADGVPIFVLPPAPQAAAANGSEPSPPKPGAELAPTPDPNQAPDRPIPYWTIGVLSLIFAIAVASVIARQLAFREARAARDAATARSTQNSPDPS